MDVCLEQATPIPIRTLQELEAVLAKVHPSRAALETRLAAQGAGRNQWYVTGACDVCGQPREFLLDWHFSNHQIPNFRERLVCAGCGLNNRQRFTFDYLRRELASRTAPVVYLYEQVTRFYHAAKLLLPGTTIIGSEYLGFDVPPGTCVAGLRHEDATRLSFADAALDILASNDVLEHVPDYRKAFAESHRVLRPGGKLLFSIPFYSRELRSRPRAVLEGGVVRHLLAEQYHGNPIREKICLVFHDFGWDVLDACREAGFRDAYAACYYSAQRAYLGDSGQLLFVAEKG